MSEEVDRPQVADGDFVLAVGNDTLWRAFCHGIGLGLHERPIISRLNSFDDPMELQAGMMFAVETYCPASDGVSAARIEEEVVVTPDRKRSADTCS